MDAFSIKSVLTDGVISLSKNDIFRTKSDFIGLKYGIDKSGKRDIIYDIIKYIDENGFRFSKRRKV